MASTHHNGDDMVRANEGRRSPRATLTLAAVLFAVALGGCSSPTPASTTKGGDTAPTTDVKGADTVDADATKNVDTSADTTDADKAVDSGPAFDCPSYCAGFTACKADISASLCVSLCTKSNSQKAARICLTTMADCDAFADCMLGAQIPIAAATRTFDTAATGYKFRDLVGDFTVPTDRGDWHFASTFNGNDSYLFVLVGKGWFMGTNGVDYGLKLFKDTTANDLKQMLALAPKNSHWFFISYNDKTGTGNGQNYVDAYKAKFNTVLASLKPLDRAWWRQRLHFVTAPAPIAGQAVTVPATLGGWLGSYTSKRSPRLFAIDRFQRLRQIGLLSLVGRTKWNSQHLSYEAQYYDYEAKRELDYPPADKDPQMKEIVLIDAEVSKAPYIDVIFPSEAEMKKYDTLEVDHAQMCKDHEQKNCFEWDYVSWLKVAERPIIEANPHAKTTCTIAVKAVLASPEKTGICVAGNNKDKSCTSATDCPDSSCKGSKKAVKAVTAVVGDTKPCQCITPRQDKVDRVYACGWQSKPVKAKAGTCKAGKNSGKSCQTTTDCPDSSCDGATAAVVGVTGYQACGCKTLDLDVQRWITTYRREGRWLSDASHSLYHFAKGGKIRFRYRPAYPYISTVKIRLRNKAKTFGAPSEVHALFTGGKFDKFYNDKYKPITVMIPKDAKRVEIVLDVTGHGFGKDTKNCAEFCDHTHHFTVKGSGGSKTWVRDQPYVGDKYGCAKQIPLGVVPNQFGTWPLGRGGWCPGQEVPVTTWDISAQATAGKNVTIEYKGLFRGKPYVPVAINGKSGFGGQISMKSWLMIYR